MKPALEWLNEVGETVMQSAFAGDKPPWGGGRNVSTHLEADNLSDALFEAWSMHQPRPH